MKYSIITDNTKAKIVIEKLLEKYPALHTDKEIEKTALIDLYMIDNNNKYYIKNGYAEYVNENNYRITVEV